MPPSTPPPETFVSSEELELVEQFEATTLANDAFGHREHVRAAWTYLQLCDLPEATRRFIAALKGFADFHGANDLYHETITWAFLLVINERIGKMARSHSWQEFADENADLVAGGAFIKGYYRQETLDSPLARRVFLLPDRCPTDASLAPAAQASGGAS